MENKEFNNSNQEPSLKTQEQGIVAPGPVPEVDKGKEESSSGKKDLPIATKKLFSLFFATIVIVAGLFIYNYQDTHIVVRQFTNGHLQESNATPVI